MAILGALWTIQARPGFEGMETIFCSKQVQPGHRFRHEAPATHALSGSCLPSQAALGERGRRAAAVVLIRDGQLSSWLLRSFYRRSRLTSAETTAETKGPLAGLGVAPVTPRPEPSSGQSRSAGLLRRGSRPKFLHTWAMACS
mmetsp:Transcript_14279/g.27718  ORF Transcript_14279/g.27718 Transcript_14279/m.27718 type:complete len:143 (+) Transcript_14279:1269-1697(+)